ncbi:hypothetical protein ACA910_005009 [Epithemia clementina (nom. ined.)]
MAGVPWFLISLFLVLVIEHCHGLNVVLAGGTGKLSQALAPRLPLDDRVTILCRNAFLAAAPNRASSQFGWVGQRFLQKNPHVSLRDWDGGDLLDIVGQDWLGWQQDTLSNADVVVHMYGGYTEQRVMACERLVRESFQFNPKALHITISPTETDLPIVEPLAAVPLKRKRISQCEEMVKANCLNSKCLRIEANRIDDSCNAILAVINELRQ